MSSAPNPVRLESLSRRDRILVVGGSSTTLELLRLAILRSEDVVLVSASVDEAVRRFVDLFAIEARERGALDEDIAAATIVLVSIGDVEAENRVVRAARRHGVPVLVRDRALVSDFPLIDFLEQRSLTLSDRHDLGSSRSNVVKAIGSALMKREVARKPVPAFRHHAPTA